MTPYSAEGGCGNCVRGAVIEDQGCAGRFGFWVYRLCNFGFYGGRFTPTNTAGDIGGVDV